MGSIPACQHMNLGEMFNEKLKSTICYFFLSNTLVKKAIFQLLQNTIPVHAYLTQDSNKMTQ